MSNSTFKTVLVWAGKLIQALFLVIVGTLSYEARGVNNQTAELVMQGKADAERLDKVEKRLESFEAKLEDIPKREELSNLIAVRINDSVGSLRETVGRLEERLARALSDNESQSRRIEALEATQKK